MAHNHLNSKRRTQKQKGFTLIELVATIFLIGVITMMLSPFIAQGLSAYESRVQTQNALFNVKLGQALMDYAVTEGDLSLPTPEDHSGFISVLPEINGAPGREKLEAFIRRSGVPFEYLLDDGSGARNARVYQTVSVSQVVPVFLSSGPDVQIDFQVGAIYSTRDPLPSGGHTALPGASIVMNSSNWRTWQTEHPDYGAFVFSTLDLHQRRLVELGERLTLLRDAFLSLHRFRLLSSTTPLDDAQRNHYPNTSGSFVSLAISAVLDEVQLTPSFNGITPWGDDIYFCPNFDPVGFLGNPEGLGSLDSRCHPSDGTASGSMNEPPFTAALAVPFQVSGHAAGDYIVLTF